MVEWTEEWKVGRMEGGNRMNREVAEREVGDSMVTDVTLQKKCTPREKETDQPTG